MNKNRDIDGSIVDWAFGEMDKGASDAFSEKLEKDPELKAEAESMKKVLGSFTQAKTDVEPPRSLRQSLLLEAAKEANRNKEKGLFSWLNLGLFKSPGVMAMASLVLVVGVFGALYSKGSMEFAELNQEQKESAAFSDTESALHEIALEEGLALDDNADGLVAPVDLGSPVESNDAKLTPVSRTAASDEAVGGILGGQLSEAVGGGTPYEQNGLKQKKLKPKTKKASKNKGSVGSSFGAYPEKKTKKKVPTRAYRPKQKSNLEDSYDRTFDNAKTTPSSLSKPTRYETSGKGQKASSRNAAISDQESLGLEAESVEDDSCLLYTSPSPRDATLSRMPSSA